MKHLFSLLILLSIGMIAFADGHGEPYIGHAIALHGDIKYGPDFEHFEYTNPDAPKGGDVVLSAIGSYESFNSFITEGIPASGIGMIYDTLTTASGDEAFTQYGLLAETIEVGADKSYVKYTLRDGAYWHDGEPITADDVVYSFETLTEISTGYGSYFEAITNIEKIDDLTVQFNLGGETNNELPLITGQLPIIPQHYWEQEENDITVITLEPPLGSGPYKVADFEAGRFVSYERVDDYWAKDLAVKKGMYNFDTLRYEYYKDTTVALEAFKANEFDFRAENVSKNWATAYDIPAVENGELIKEFVPNDSPQGMQAFYLNNRKEKFSDPKVREALTYAFDFEWTNENLFYGQYTRTDSFFENSDLASTGIPEGKELEYLESFRDQLPAALFTEAFTLPSTDGAGNNRANLGKAIQIFKEAGWEIQNGALTNVESGEVMTVEFMLRSPTFERVVAPYIDNLKRIGIDASQLTLDGGQWYNRLLEFDFDSTIMTRTQSRSPGNEQKNYWTTDLAQEPGSWNIAGIENPVIDALVEEVIAAPDRESLVAATQALDRVLLWGYYVIPQWHIAGDRILYWDKFSRPETLPMDSVGFPTIWWMNDAP